MAKSGIRLSDKSYFTPDDVAERWACSVSNVLHYMDEGQLRPAIRTDNVLGLFTLLPKSRACDSIPSFLYLSAATIKFKSSELSVAKSILDGTINNPSYLWSKTNATFYTSELETLDGKKFNVLSETDKGRVYSLNGLLKERKSVCSGRHWRWKVSAVVVTHEELDRFEREHEVFEGIGRVPADAPRIAWIEEKLAERGLYPPIPRSAGGRAGPRAEIKREALRERYDLFTKATFDHAWKKIPKIKNQP